MARKRSELAAAASLFAALGDPQRMVLVERLGQAGPLSIARLTDGTTITRQGVAKHLAVLEAAGVARSERTGRETIWALEENRLRDARRQLERISAQWDSAIERLRAFVEEED